jgi:hypothetical protein
MGLKECHRTLLCCGNTHVTDLQPSPNRLFASSIVYPDYKFSSFGNALVISRIVFDGQKLKKYRAVS